MVAPEGTTKHGNVLLRFSTGAFVPGRPVLPVLLKYRHQHFDVGWGITTTPWHMFRLLTQFVNHLEVRSPLPPHPKPHTHTRWAGASIACSLSLFLP
jgi:lysophosphatidylcholine acyltransferase/lyso-PAF acetyltransferase